jgi:hypothetical protein
VRHVDLEQRHLGKLHARRGEYLVTALDHPLTWASPRPMWRGAASPGRAPTILRFASDEFMDQLLGLLATDPAGLTQHVARYESWRTGQSEQVSRDLVERLPLPKPIRQARLATSLARAPVPAAAAETPARRLKLYQPAHQRYYVAAASLACAVPGLPDRRLGGGHEQVGFLLRRLMPASSGAGAGAPLVEYGFVKDSNGGRWQRVADEDEAVLAPGEERLPAFPLAHMDGNGLNRTMWGGLIPVGRREEYLSAPVTRAVQLLAAGQTEAAMTAGTAPATLRNSKLARTTEFKLDFAEPWKGLIQAAIKGADEIEADKESEDDLSGSRQSQLRSRNLQYQMQSWLLLVDLMAFFDRHLKTVAAAVRSDSSAGLSGAKRDLYLWLSGELGPTEQAALANGFQASGVDSSGRPAFLPSIAEALRRIDGDGAAKVEAAETVYQDVQRDVAGGDERVKWPDFHYLLAGIASDGSGGSIDAHGGFRTLTTLTESDPPDDEIEALTAPLLSPPDPTLTVVAPPQSFDLALVETLTVLVARALDTSDEADARPLPFAQRLSQAMQDSVGDTGQFRIRFVHLNEDCGPLHPPTLSEPSEAFELANFFDSDAPARPVRISLPMDTSPAGLRKHARGTAFVLSDLLCGQVQRAKGLGLIDLIRHVLPWPLHKSLDVGDGGGCKTGNNLEIGMICSLSIPIVTLCALILLMIIVGLLDFIFRWLPWFIFCFPVPKLKGKGATP